MENARLRTALHEAGHTVAARRQGCDILHLKLTSDGVEGVCRHTVPSTLSPRGHAIICVAGRVAECLFGELGRKAFTRSSPDMVFAPGTPSDTEQLASLGMDWNTPGLVREAMILLYEHEGAVEGLANVLIRRRFLSGEDAEVILNSYEVPKPETPQ
jgi:hypothetical protein